MDTKNNELTTTEKDGVLLKAICNGKYYEFGRM